MNAFKFLRNVYLCHFSKPVANRALYKALRTKPMRSIVEIGLGELQRTKVMLELALQTTAAEELKFTGIDLFEARAETARGVSLKQAHKELKAFQTKLQLVPGDAFSGLARCANGLVHTDLVVISRETDSESLAKAWFYLPRMLHDGSQVFLEETHEGLARFRLLKRLEIEQLASTAARSMRRAA